MHNKNVILKAFFYGLPIGVLLNFLVHILLTGDKAYLGDDKVSLLLFSIVCLAFITMFINHFRNKNTSKFEYSQVALLTIIFSFTVAASIGIGHFINATFIDPQWAEKSLELLQKKWTANNLSEVAIAGQIEWTDTFHNPWKWSVVLIIFFFILYSIPGFIIGSVLYFRYIQSQKSHPQKITLI